MSRYTLLTDRATLIGMVKQWARTALVLVAIALMLLVGIAVQRARARVHQQVPTPPILSPR